MSSPFSQLSAMPPDPLFGLKTKIKEIRQKDPGAKIIDLSLGVFRDKQGNPHVPLFVQAAHARATHNQVNNNEYFPMAGPPDFLSDAIKLVLGNLTISVTAARIVSLGGTGALAAEAKLLRILQDTTGKKIVVFIGKPIWANNVAIAEENGLTVVRYDYLGANGMPDPNNLSKAMEEYSREHSNFIPVVLLHGVCQNSTGLDYTPNQQSEVIQIIKKFQALAWIDLAYFLMGFGEKGRGFTTSIVEAGIITLLAISFSKNAALYGDRVGVAAILNIGDATSQVQSILEVRCVRRIYSNPPIHGVRTMAMVLSDSGLKKGWLNELKDMREDLNDRRQKFYNLTGKRFPSVVRGKGLFAELGLTPQQVNQLAEPFFHKKLGVNVYVIMPKSSRVNFGFGANDIPLLCERVNTV